MKLKKGEDFDSREPGRPQPDLLLGDVRNPPLDLLVLAQLLQRVVLEGHGLLVNEGVNGAVARPTQHDHRVHFLTGEQLLELGVAMHRPWDHMVPRQGQVAVAHHTPSNLLITTLGLVCAVLSVRVAVGVGHSDAFIFELAQDSQDNLFCVVRGDLVGVARQHLIQGRHKGPCGTLGRVSQCGLEEVKKGRVKEGQGTSQDLFTQAQYRRSRRGFHR